MGLVKDWQITLEELDDIVSARPSLRGFLFGYLTEYKLGKLWFSDTRIKDLTVPDNHDRKHKADLHFIYRDVEIRVECKGLQSNSVEARDTGYFGRFQCDASDKREVALPSGKKLQTTCLVVGEFDLLAVGLFQFGSKWRFAFARNEDLPRTRACRYKESEKQYLLAGTMDISWPLKPPFRDEPFTLLDEIVAAKRRSDSADTNPRT